MNPAYGASEVLPHLTLPVPRRAASTTMTPVASSSVREVATELMHLLRLSLVTRGCYCRAWREFGRVVSDCFLGHRRRVRYFSQDSALFFFVAKVVY